ncbi:MAG: response regulator [Thermodesulfobacteriota bacterium]|nr:response regulator [Thermodesulfobacteriota bacterium]
MLYRTSSDQLMHDLQQRIHDLVSVAALQVDGDLHHQLIHPEQEGNSTYLQLKQHLQKLRDSSSDIFYIYTMRKNQRGKIEFVVDATDNSEEIAHLGEIYSDARTQLRNNFTTLQRPLVEDQFYTDTWGTWLSGYAPFYDSQGDRAGILGIDISAQTVIHYKQQLLKRALTAIGIILPLILLLGYLMGRRFSSPIIAMKSTVELIGDGDLCQRVDIESNDELGSLADTFNHMTQQLQQNQRQLQSMATTYRSIFDNATEGIFQATTQGRFITVNQALVAMLGYASEQELCSTIADIEEQLYTNPQERKATLQQLREQGRIDGMQVAFTRKDGSSFYVQLNLRTLSTKEGEIIQGMALDISERRKKEQAEKERKAAELASQAKSDFLANMSHEIRTPLNAVMGLTDLLQRTEVTAKQADYLSKIKSSSRSLLSVINDILDFSKIEAGHLKLEEIPFSLYEVMANLAEMFSHKAHEQEIELLIHIDDQVPSALIGDPTRLGQILINLTGNALKFTRQGEIVIAVRLCQQQDDETEQLIVEFSVTDTGIGIESKRLETIFDSFTQADSSTTRKFGGTGLGLTICRQLTQLMGGNITIESDQGKGSTFCFTVALRLQPDDQQISMLPPVDLRGLRVLIVDDNKTARDILASIIDSFQMQATTASSGQEALELLQQDLDGFDLVLLDWKMPEMNGLQTARQVKSNLHLNKLPIICMISAYGREDLMQQGERKFLDAFLHKPVNQSFLFDAIMELFGRQKNMLDNKKQRPTTEPLPEKIQLAGRRVLLVEDKEINREIAIEWLKSAEISVEIAEDGQQAVDFFADPDVPLFDGVLMDIQMPNMDGLEATRKLRQNVTLQDLPIIAMTAHAMQGDREKCLAAGMNDYITKPIDPRLLFSTLAKWIGNDSTSSTAVPSLAEKTHRSTTSQAVAIPEPSQIIAGIDTAQGLYRVNQNQKLYHKLLRSFAAEYAAAAEKIEQMLQQQNHQAAREMSHSIKGLAANLGAIELSQLAANVELLLIQEQPTANILKQLPMLTQELLRVTASIKQQLSLPAATIENIPPPMTVLDSSELIGQLQFLNQFLDDDLVAAQELLAKLEPQLRHPDSANCYDTLYNAMDVR